MNVRRRLFIARSDKFFNTILLISSRRGAFLVLKLGIIPLISLKLVKKTLDWLGFVAFNAFIVDVTLFSTLLVSYSVVKWAAQK